ncbi:MAG: formate dehydrogenase accessory protein FdhE [Candidatus Omnitrophica bacterium]|nr:formate dehydrogenase accessory protein FdhE [Candidatus Omnitrophota bacterium]
MENYSGKLENLKSLEYISPGQADFFKALLNIKEKAKKSIAEADFRLNLSRQDLAARLNKSLPILTFPEIPFKNNLLEEIFQDISGLIKQYNLNSRGEIDSLAGYFQDQKLNLAQFIKDVTLGQTANLEAIEKLTGVKKNTLIFVANQLAKPFFESAAESLNFKLKDNQWLKGYCPVCGSAPLMAKLSRDDGKRILECCLCGTNWPFLRVKCPFCGNEDKDYLRFFFVDDQSQYRVDVCDKCKRYIKTVDERKLPKDQEVVLAVDNIATSYLDILAEKENYVDFYSEQVVAEAS